MRTLCDSCESAAATLFCAADEAALCRSCDEKVHTCNKLASRHLRVGLANPSEVPRCDVCENAPAFFFCEIDGSSLCLQCDLIVHVGGKRLHKRYLVLRQRVEFPADEPNNLKDSHPQIEQIETVRSQNQQPRMMTSERQEKLRLSEVVEYSSRGNKGIDLNMKPYTHILHGQASNNQDTL